ncbi:MAG TPA: 16S rRNA (adenine(1518)-N(6)/adenine(1519)-N(6))-dimethyltransferase RsmA [Candidatus Acidoferrales bacterium]|jgi:16S rRNA (adenine1518-N6/adenine1519-N6)-dimethyltransferase|nr:16S rRNA (adenine(1518)-N(6)/adenine(1519)-N(6))-dimethyltransferase RsmA [Candidatus Acidoferrales bacterium]
MSPERLGQHFLADANWQERIVDDIHIDNGRWVEIGAGHGEMTTRLAQRASKLYAVEVDPSLARRLRQVTAPFKNVEIVHSDVMAVDFEKLTSGERFSVYGNLPYYITSPILHRLFEHADRIAAIHIVIQYEVAVRIMARPGRRDYGYLSVASQWYGKPEIAFRIPPGAFNPPPKVDSALVSFHMPGERAKIRVSNEHAFLEFVKECFAQKRKTLRNNLRARLGTRTEEILEAANLPSDARAEQLTISQFAVLFPLAL